MFNHLDKVACCKICHESIQISVVRRYGLAASIRYECKSCENNTSFMNCSNIKKNIKGQDTNIYELNVRIVYAFRAIGKGRTGASMFLGVMNLPNLTSTFPTYEKVLGNAAEVVCKRYMQNAVNDAIVENNNSPYL